MRRRLLAGLLIACTLSGSVLLPFVATAQADTSLWQRPLSDLVRKASNEDPSLTGGAITIGSGVLGASLISMALHLSERKQKGEKEKGALDSVRVRLLSVLDSLKGVADADVVIFRRFLAAMRLPKRSEEEKVVRDSVIRSTLQEAIVTPLGGARLFVSILETTADIATLCNPVMASDLGAGSRSVKASLEGLLGMVKSNLAEWKGSEKGSWMQASADLQKRGDMAAGTIDRFVQIHLANHP